MRREYEARPFDLADADPDPYRQFERWFEEVSRTDGLEANAAVLATADGHGRPSARHVLVKAVEQRGFVFYTNYHSRKGRQLEVNPHAALVFAWAPVGRQVCVEGAVRPVTDEESDEYFAQRPREAQLGAWASAQSHPLGSRQELEQALAAMADRFAGLAVPRPPHWGGYRLEPQRVEFWQGRVGRLHDRLCYELEPSGWRIERLNP